MDRKSLFCACVFFMIIAGCNPTTPPSDAGPGLDAYTPPGVDAFVPGTDGFVPGSDAFIPPPDAGPPGCTSDAECNDGGDCTTDTCNIVTGDCRHVVTPALCAAGESCNTVTGDCEMGRACATHADCTDTDACTTMELCDSASRVCTFRPLDGDSDGDPPRVCGGGDCNDGNAAISSLDDELCNMMDDDCDAAIDEDFDFDTDPMNCGACRRTCVDGICVAGECACAGDGDLCTPPSRSAFCTDLSTDPSNCGACGTRCPLDAGAGDGSMVACVAGTCDCPGTETACGLNCVETQTDENNCGMCGRVCPTSQECISGTCACPTGQTDCAGTCIDTVNDPYNCGGCGIICSSTSCVSGRCTYASCPSPTITCGGSSTCPFYDPLNCGGCGISCDPGHACIRSTCH